MNWLSKLFFDSNNQLATAPWGSYSSPTPTGEIFMYELKKMKDIEKTKKFDFDKMPLSTMDVGEFFSVVAEPCDRQRLSSGLTYRAFKLGKKFSARKSEAGFYICRIA